MKSNNRSEKGDAKRIAKGKEKVIELPGYQSSIELDADDSSDEEEMESLREAYKLEEQYVKAKDKLPKYITDVDSNLYSYTSLALGVELLYSKEVNETYYKKKRELLSGSKIKFDVKTIIRKVLYKIINDLFDIKKSGYGFREFRNELLNKYKEENAEFINEVVESFAKDIRYVVKQAIKLGIVSQLSGHISQLKENIKNYINSLEEKEINSFPTPLPFTLQGITYDKDIQNILKDKIFSEKIEWLRQGEIITAEDRTVSNNARESYLLKTNIQKLRVTASDEDNELLDKISTITRGGVPITKKLEQYIVDLIKPKLKQLLDNELNNKDPIIKQLDVNVNEYQIIRNDFTNSCLEVLFKGGASFFEDYLPYKLEGLKNELLEKVDNNFNNIFVRRIQYYFKEAKIKRKVLDKSFLFISNNPTEFFANLRLSNRSQTRHIKNISGSENNISKSNTVYRSWKFGANQEIALERQNITYNIKKSKYSRSDIVDNLGNYAEVNTLINKALRVIKERNIETDQKLIARAVLSVLECKDTKKLDINQNGISYKLKREERAVIINLTYLMFGCEVVRNPSSLITGLMLLDLISHGELTWKDIFNSESKVNKFGGGIMPMSMGKYEYTMNQGITKGGSGEPVPCARKLQAIHKSYLFIPYSYQGQEKSDVKEGKEKIKELISREAEVVYKWINMVNRNEIILKQEPVTTSTVNPTSNSTNDFSWVNKILQNAKERINQLDRHNYSK